MELDHWRPSEIDRFENVFIAKDCEDSPLSRRLQSLFPKSKIHIVESGFEEQFAREMSAEEFDLSKKQILLKQFKGQFFKRCPGSKPGLACCNYFVLNLGQQCDMNCSYCYLQSFLNSPFVQIYENINQALEELRDLKKDLQNVPVRIGTGELIDSLSMDDITLYSRQLIPFFKETPNWQLEFKTKSCKVHQFIDLGPAPNVVVSWSINPQSIVENEEHGTASLKERIAAAKLCKENGFAIAFHIDPVVWHPEWKQSYKELVSALTSTFSPDDLPYLSLGALRFQPEQRHIMRERFGFDSHVVRAEMFSGDDGKLRYDKTLRYEMFNFIIDEFKSHSPKWKIFLCMETPETWLRTYKSMPKQVSEISQLFDNRVTRSFNQSLS